MMLDITPLKKAVAQLELALEYAEATKTHSDPNMETLMRSAAIQAFEVTYELSFKYLRRFLEEMEGSEKTIKELTFDGIIRRGYEEGLLDADIVAWRDFRTNRGTTSHGYDEVKAQKVFDKIPPFFAEAKFLLQQLERRINQ